jgi:TolA-binding protein
VQYLDPAGSRQRRPINQVESMGFDGLPELDQAEAAVAIEDFPGAIMSLLRAAVNAQTDLQELWLHARLARVHDLNGDYVQAAGHAAEVFMRSDDVAWRDLRPVSSINEPLYPAAKEALDRLQSAARKVKSGELKRDIDVMIKNVQPVTERLGQQWTGGAIEPGSTISGLTRAQIAGEQPAAASNGAPVSRAPAAESPAVAAPESAPDKPAPAPAEQPGAGDPRSPQAIDALLAAGRHAQALTLCAEIEKNPGDRDLAHFLYQYGRALALASRKKDAAVMFTRCAILYPDSPDVGPALIETAMIYRDEYRKPDVARRLLERVIAQAQDDAQASTAALARELLATLK